MMANQTFSDFIPVYNAEQYIRTCVKSVMAQRYRPLEVILVNDGSTDNGRLIAEHFPGKIFRKSLFDGWKLIETIRFTKNDVLPTKRPNRIFAANSKTAKTYLTQATVLIDSFCNSTLPPKLIFFKDWFSRICLNLWTI